MPKDSAQEILDQLRGFIEISGEETPSDEQWKRIVALVKKPQPEESK